MKKGFKVLDTVGQGDHIIVTNFQDLNQVVHYRFGKNYYKKAKSYSDIGVWKPKQK